MSLADLDERERGIVHECLRAAVEGPFFPEREFSIIFGLTRSELKEILSAWPELDESDENVVRAINNSMNNLLGYPLREKMVAWPEFISISRPELAPIFFKWKEKPSDDRYVARSHFENAM